MGDEEYSSGARSWDESTEKYVTGREWSATVAGARGDAGTEIFARSKWSPGDPGEA